MGVLGWLLVVVKLPLPPHALSTRSARINTPTLFRTGFCQKAKRPFKVVLLFYYGVTAMVTPGPLTPLARRLSKHVVPFLRELLERTRDFCSFPSFYVHSIEAVTKIATA